MNASAIQGDWVGQVIDGRFTLLQWLGGSARSGVFLTELPGPPGRKAAIKLTIADSGEDIEKRVAGWDATRTLSHPNLMRILQTGRCEWGDGTLLYSVSEYADEVLSEILPERALTADEAREMLAPIVDALAYLHGKGLVHGHLKPSNILVVDDTLKLSGDSLQTPDEGESASSDLSIYDAPERAKGVVSAENDVWSLGVTLVEALTQKTPVWDRATDPLVPGSIAQPLAGIARGCLRADPLVRCSVNDVKSMLGGKAVAKSAAKAVLAELAEEPREKAREKFPVTLLVAALVVIVAVVAVLALRSHKADTTAPGAATATESQPQTAPAATPEPVREKPAPGQPAQTQDEAQPAAASAPETPAAVNHAAPTDMLANGAVVSQVQPDVLPRAMASIHGKFDVRIRVSVDAAGNVADASFDSEGPSKYFANAAMAAVKQWKFKPGQAGTTVLQFRFTHAGAQITTVNPK